MRDRDSLQLLIRKQLFDEVAKTHVERGRAAARVGKENGASVEILSQLGDFLSTELERRAAVEIGQWIAPQILVAGKQVLLMR